MRLKSVTGRYGNELVSFPSGDKDSEARDTRTKNVAMTVDCGNARKRLNRRRAVEC